MSLTTNDLRILKDLFDQQKKEILNEINPRLMAIDQRINYLDNKIEKIEKSIHNLDLKFEQRLKQLTLEIGDYIREIINPQFDNHEERIKRLEKVRL